MLIVRLSVTLAALGGTAMAGDLERCLAVDIGNAGWERHLNGDELVQVVAGSTEFDIIVEDDDIFGPYDAPDTPASRQLQTPLGH